MIPYLFTIVSPEKLKDMFHTFEAIIGLPIQIIDENGILLGSETPVCPYCQIFKRYLKNGESIFFPATPT